MTKNTKNIKALLGIHDAKGLQGILSRGKNVYGSGFPQAHKGGGLQYGRPSKAAIRRRIGKKHGILPN